ncbi:RsmB/NOP family class I SAM-dependent RNA methyltransferase [Shewanella psychrotolerans]|uniref:RsmB/NOP family class I SAM-dependent RNA methyltransferase n=1 Tax=Shewanella psychrotolerans TaxID=2864206 RepID=UPI001C656B0E|nr:RsmB/NOP family class I SAM-dependent RNA methyltransferase [Shewanella psychrotolerans]QYK00420.1 RsmB/NOP family class I SAM-dependent RNA methyltransferase [Shewanella psychrotolerans]
MVDTSASPLTSAATDKASNVSITETIHQDVNADTSPHKRALSYSITIHQLFEQVMQSKMPADRVVAEYFRTHKKHGSKDRRVIRESLFGLFRWHGWLKQLPQVCNAPQAWFASLVLTAKIEDHPWQDIRDAWFSFAALTELEHINNTNDISSLVLKLKMMQNCFSELAIAITDLVPNWFWAHYPDSTPQEQHALIESLCSRPPIWGRLQGIDGNKAIAALSDSDIPASMSAYFSDAINLGHKSINLNGLTLYTEGQLEIQDLGSQVIGNICMPKDDQLWWDTCSGAGGKTLQLRSLMLQQNPHSKGSIVASDIRRKPLEELNKRAKRAGFTQIRVSPWQSDALPVPSEHFDGVLVDAPCSCTGTWRRNPDMRWLDDETAITDKPALQLDILSRASAAVKSGGVLVYATCSLSPSENEAVVESFLATHGEFTLQALTHPFTGDVSSMLTVLPYQADSDGMFVAKMVKG